MNMAILNISVKLYRYRVFLDQKIWDKSVPINRKYLNTHFLSIKYKKCFMSGRYLKLNIAYVYALNICIQE